MKAMILAAGRGERLRPLTDHTPKPLLEVGGVSLIERHLQALAQAGFTEVVINAAWRADRLLAALGDGRRLGVRIRWSVEVPGQLDTGGGVRAALPLLGSEPFALISADALTDFDFACLPAVDTSTRDATVVLVDNPPHHPDGDFGIRDGWLVAAEPRHTYAGIGVYSPRLFHGKPLRFSLAEVIRDGMARQRVGALHHDGLWIDVGRPAALEQARRRVGS